LSYLNRMWGLPNAHITKSNCFHLYFRADVTADGKEQYIVDREIVIISIISIIGIHYILLIYGLVIMLKHWRKTICEN